jgi:hypothetical protein
MLDTYIKNRGITKTLIHDNKNNHNQVNEIKWDADYDGDRAKVKINLDVNGHHRHINFSLDNHDLAKILNIPSVDLPLEKRLKKDFYVPNQEPIIYRIELEKEPMIMPIKYEEPSSRPSSIIEMLKSVEPPSKKSSYLPSPLSNENLLIPLTIDDNKSANFSLTPRRRHRKYRTHKTYRVYRQHKKSPSSRRSSSRKSSTSRRSSSRKSYR